MTEDILKQLNNLKPNQKKAIESREDHSRYQIKNDSYKKVLIHNAPYIFTCKEDEKLVCLENHSIEIENDIIKTILPAKEAKKEKYDIVYDAGKRGGVVITPGLINAHAHPPMYLLRTAMTFDEGEDILETLAALPQWEEKISQPGFALSTVGDISEQQKHGSTTTLSQYNYFDPVEVAANLTKQNIVNGISVASHCKTDNSPKLIEKLIKSKKNSQSTLAMTVHYLYKANPEILKQVQKIIEKNNILFTCHMSESEKVVKETLKKYNLREAKVLEKFGLLNENTLLSHAIHLEDEEIKKIVNNNVGIVHLPTSNTIHKSGVFPYWKFNEAGGGPRIALGTDSVVSKSRMDILTEAYQTRMTHLYTRPIKFGTLFKMMTVNGARVLHMPDRGKLVPGMKADICFWKLKDRGFIPYDKDNPFTLLGNLITHNGRTVRDLMINGKFIIKNRKHRYIDESKLLDQIEEEHKNIRKNIS